MSRRSYYKKHRAKISKNSNNFVAPSENKMPEGVTKPMEDTNIRVSEDIKNTLSLISPFFTQVLSQLESINTNLENLSFGDSSTGGGYDDLDSEQDSTSTTPKKKKRNKGSRYHKKSRNSKRSKRQRKSRNNRINKYNRKNNLPQNVNNREIKKEEKEEKKQQKQENKREKSKSKKELQNSVDFFKKFQNSSNKFFGNMIKSGSQIMDKNNKALRSSLLGPLNLVLKPIEDFTGVSLKFSSIFDVSSKLMGSLLGGKKDKKKEDQKKKETPKKPINKKHPSASDLVKNQDLGALFLTDFFKDNMEKKSQLSLPQLPELPYLNMDKLLKPSVASNRRGAVSKTATASKSVSKGAKGVGGLLGGLSSGGMSNILPTITKYLSPIAIVTSIVMAITDGIMALFKSKEWGVSRISAFFAGFFASTSSGWKGAFSAMGKWALLGVGIGMPFAPPIGPIVGGILGAVIGGILGFIGGQKIAKGFDKMGAWFKDVVWEGIKNYFLNLWQGIKDYFLGFKDIWSSDKSIGRKLGETVRLAFQGLWNLLTFPFREGGKLFKNAIKLINNLIKKIDFKKDFSGFFEKIKKGLSGLRDIIWDGIMSIIEKVKSFFTWENIKNLTVDTAKFLRNVADKVFGFVYEFIAGVFGIETTWDDFKEKVAGVLDRFIVKPISNVFNKIIDVFQYIGDLFEFVKSQGWGIFETAITGKFGEKFNEYRVGLGREISVDDAILRKDGTIVRTSPDDNIIATKNDPSNFMELNKFTSDKLEKVSYDNSLTNKLDKMIGLLSKLVDKDVTITMPSQTKQDLIHIVEGVI